MRKHSEVKEGGNVAWRQASWSSGRGRWHSHDVRGTAGPGAPAGGQRGCKRRRRAAWDPGGGVAGPLSTTRGRPHTATSRRRRGNVGVAGKEGSRGEAFWGGWGGGRASCPPRLAPLFRFTVWSSLEEGQCEVQLETEPAFRP